MSSEKPITLKEAIRLLQSGAWLHGLRFFTANVEKGTGGQVIELAKCRIARNYNKNTGTDKSVHTEQGKKKNPDHNFHFTRNMELPNREIIKVHPILITHINQHPIL